jgi:hypothetical protein
MKRRGWAASPKKGHLGLDGVLTTHASCGSDYDYRARRRWPGRSTLEKVGGVNPDKMNGV